MGQIQLFGIAMCKFGCTESLKRKKEKKQFTAILITIVNFTYYLLM